MRGKKGKEGGIVTFLAVLGVIFLLWLGYSGGKSLCESGYTCDTTQPNIQEDTQQDTNPTENETTNSEVIILREGEKYFPANN